MLRAMQNNWWMLVGRGIVAVLFGVLALLLPGITLTVLVLLFGAYVLVDGGINIYSAIQQRDSNDRWWLGLIEGAVGVLVGIGTLIVPGITALALLFVIAFWAVVTGGLEVYAAYRLREEIKHEWLLGLSGILSISFGVLLVLAPGSGALALAWLIGMYAILFGVMLILLGVNLRNMPNYSSQS